MQEINQRMGGRVVEGTGLENQRRATYRGFESHPIRFFFTDALNSVGIFAHEKTADYQSAVLK